MFVWISDFHNKAANPAVKQNKYRLQWNKCHPQWPLARWCEVITDIARRRYQIQKFETNNIHGLIKHQQHNKNILALHLQSYWMLPTLCKFSLWPESAHSSTLALRLNAHWPNQRDSEESSPNDLFWPDEGKERNFTWRPSRSPVPFSLWFQHNIADTRSPYVSSIVPRGTFAIKSHLGCGNCSLLTSIWPSLCDLPWFRQR